MINIKLSFKLVSVFMLICLILSGCIAVDNSAYNANENVETEYRHIKNTIHNYVNSNSSGDSYTNDSSDYQESYDSVFKPDNLTPNEQDNTENDEEDDSDNNNEDVLPPEINYDDVIVVPETDIFSEDFEDYGDAGTAITEIEKGYKVGGGDSLTVTVEGPGAPEGDYYGKFYSVHGSQGWSAVYYNFTTANGEEYDFQNWEKQKYISFWAKQDGSVRKLIMGINDGVNNARAEFAVTSEWAFYSIALDQFVSEDFTITNVKNFHMTWSGGTGSTYIDDLRVTEKEVKVYDKFIPESDAFTIENGEYYEGDDLGVKAAYSIIEGDANSTLSTVELSSTEKKNGEYSIRFTGKPEENKTTSAFTAALAKEMILSDFNAVKLNLKGDGTAGQKVTALLFNGDNQIAGKEFEITSDWGNYTIPITLPADSQHLEFDRIAIISPLSASESVFYLDDFVISTKDGVLETPANIVENGEYYTDTYTVSDAYTNSGNTSVAVALDRTVKHSGDNSVKFTVPAVVGAETEGLLIYDFQTKTITKNNHFKVRLHGVGLTSAQNVKFEVLDTSGTVAATLETELTNETDWAEMYIVNSSGAEIDIKSMRITFPMGTSAYSVWLDDLEIFTPEGGLLPAVATDVIQETREVAAGNNHATFTYEENFSIPKDCSGSDGYILLTRHVRYGTRIRLTIYTANGNSTQFDTGISSDASNTTLTDKILLSDIGLTDEDMACVIGYEAKVNTSSSVPKLKFSISVPRPAIVTNTIQTPRHVIAGNNHSTVIVQENFATPLNCSGSDGYILIKRSVKYNTRIRLTLYTANGSSTQFDSGYCDISDTSLTTIVPLADIGLTDDDLASIIGYDVRVNTSSSIPEIDFSIYIPKPGENIEDF